MRGDAAVTIRLLLRGTGMAGLAAAVGGLAALAALLLPWHEGVATVEMLGATSSRAETRAGVPIGAWWAWLSAGAAVTATWLGLGIAFDRPVSWARTGLLAATAAMSVAALAALLAPPELAAVIPPDQPVARIVGRLPTGVDLDLGVRASVGPWMTLVAAALVAVGGVSCREL